MSESISKDTMFIRVEDIGKVCDPCKDHGVRHYSAREIAEAIYPVVLYPRKNGKSTTDLKKLLERLGEG